MAKIGSYPVVDSVQTTDQFFVYRSQSGETVKIPYSVLRQAIATAFTQLSDTPGDYIGQAGKTLAVNTGENALEFVENTLSPTFQTLPDTPIYTGNALGRPRVNAGETALEYSPVSFLENSDVTAGSYAGLGGSLIRVNAGETGLEFFPGAEEIPNLFLISEEADLPALNGAGEHELLPDKAYWFTGPITLANPLRFVAKTTEIYGNGSGQTKITYTGTGAAIRASAGAAIRGRAFEINTSSGDGLAMVGGGGPGTGDSIVLERVSVKALSGTAITGDGIDQLIMGVSSAQGSNPIVFFGSCGLFSFSASLALAFAANPCVSFGTATFNTVSMAASSITGVPGATGLSGLSLNGNLTATGTGTVEANTFVGALTPLSGISTEDTRWRFIGNTNLADSNTIAFAYIDTPATTSVVSAGVEYQVAGTWAAQADTERATVNASGEIEFFNKEETKGTISATFTATKVGGGTGSYTFKVQKNPNGSGWVDVPQIKKTVTLTSTTVSVTLLGIGKYVENDEFRLVIVGNATTDDVDVDVTQFVIGS